MKKHNYIAPRFKVKQIDCILEPVEGQNFGLYLGDIFSAEDYFTLGDLKIGAVLTCAKKTGLKYPKGAMKAHMIIPANDIPGYNIYKHLPKGIRFIEKHIQHTNVFVHCMAGVSRSGAMVVAYIMKTKKLDFYKSMVFTRQRRPMVYPNPGF